MLSSGVVVLCLCALAHAAHEDTISIIMSSRDTDARLSPQPPASFGQDVPFALTISIDHSKARQTVLGFGGAFTEAAAVNFAALSPDNQNTVLKAYWGEGSIGYTMGRIPINSCDFSVKTYSFDDTVDDFALKDFDHNVTHDQAAMIPLIKAAIRTASTPLRLYGSPWSPPAWMKLPHPEHGQGMNGSASPIGLQPGAQYQQAWADYLSTWVSAYQAQGIPLWGLTVQNEPRALQVFESCLYTPESQRDFVRDYLGPTLARNHPTLTLMVWDHNKYNVTTPDAPLENMLVWAQTILADPVAAKYVDGVAFHWYQIFEHEGFNFDVLEAVHAVDPTKFLLNTEACYCPPANPADWFHGELYGNDIIGDLNAWSVGWVDWNLLLSAQGGPNHVGNYCEAPIMLTSAGELRFLPQYYYMGQLSKYILPNSVVIASTITGPNPTVESEGITLPTLAVVAVERPDGQTVVVVQNSGDAQLPFKLLDKAGRAAILRAPAHSITTYIYATA